MSHPWFNIVELFEGDENDEQKMLTDSSTCDTIKPRFCNANFLRSLAPVENLIDMAAKKEGCNFNIFVSNQDSKSLPKHDPRATQSEIMDKIPHFNKIANIRYIRSGSLIIHTTDSTCVIEACRISTFMGVPVSTCIDVN